MSDTKVDENVSKYSDLEKTYKLVRKKRYLEGMQ